MQLLVPTLAEVVWALLATGPFVLLGVLALGAVRITRKKRKATAADE